MNATDTTAARDVDHEAAETFAGRLLELYTGTTVTYLIDIGRRTGLFDATAAGPATSEEVTARAGLQERYVREWLAAMASAGIVEYQPATGHYWLPREHAACLTGTGPENLAGLAFFSTMLGKHVPAVADAFRSGGGVPYEAYTPEIHEALDLLWGPIFSQFLVPEYLLLAPGLTERLSAGARVADVGCGTGNALVALAAAFPQSQFVGYDLDAGALERARAAATSRGLCNVSFVEADAAELTVDEPFDAVFVFNTIHDQAEPEKVLRRIHDALAPGGILFMDEPAISSRLENNLAEPMAAFVYSVSTLHCLTQSLAVGGAGLGTAWGRELAEQMLAGAGFGPVTIHDAPADPGNGVFVTTRPAA